MNPIGDPGPGKRLTGAVLCGGFSLRMGSDKGLIESGGISWAVRMGQKLRVFGLPVLYSIRDEQEEAYRKAMPAETLVTDNVDMGGPLNGIFSIHHFYPDRDILLLACDMQDLDEQTIDLLIREYRRGPAEFYVYDDGEFVQPFCAVYTATGLARAWQQTRDWRSLQTLIAKGNTKKLAIKNSGAFANHNRL